MAEIATIALPFFGLILLGYGAGRLKAIPAQGIAGLDFFANYLALPALFFWAVASTPRADLPGWSFLLTTAFATYCAFAIAFSFGALVSRGNVPEATIQGMVGSAANIGIMAPGLVIGAFGSGVGAAMALVFVFDFAMLAILAPLMMVLGIAGRTNGRAMALGIARDVFLHPVVIATILGVVASLVRLRLPTAVDGLLGALRAGAAPAALFAFGVNLATVPFGRVQPGTAVLIGIKLIVHPAIVYLLLGWIGGFEGAWVNAAVLMAALPPAASVLAAAERHGTWVARAAAAILLGSLASVATVSLILALILDGVLPIDPFG